LALDGTPIDPTPVTILTTTATSVAAAAIGNTFYVAYTYAFSFNQQRLAGVRVSGSNLSLIGSVTDLGAVYDKNPVVRTLGNQWLVVFEVQQSHDQLPSSVMSRLIDANGLVTSTLVVNTSGDADVPDVAIAGSRALIVWHDYTSLDAKIMGRLLDQNGSFVGAPFVVSDANNRQYFPTVAWDGQRFVAAWTDFRSNNGIEQLRGNIYAARISYDGVVADPNGIPVTSGPLPEDAPAAAAFSGKTVIAFSKLNGLAGNPEIQRIGYRILENTAGGGVEITMTPVNPPIQIPATGGSFSFNVSIQNTSTSQQTFDGWIMQILPDLSWQGPMLGPVNLTLTPGFTLTRNRNQNVPGSALPGTYTYIGYVGLYATVKWDSSFFNYTKLSSGDGALVGNWENWGESFDPWTGHPANPVPSEFSVSGAYPNPFNPTTAISYRLPAESFVSLEVYDTAGRPVSTLVNGQQEAGQHQVNFDGLKLPSGVYFYRLSAGNYTATDKMVLMK